MCKRKKISILIPAWNAENFIFFALDSALTQTWPDVELLIVDDGSTDHTLDLLKTIVDKRLKVISQPNRGASAARNVAFEASTGDYIQYLDADDMLHPDKIASQMKMVEKYGNEYVYAGKWGTFLASTEDVCFSSNSLWQDFNSGSDWLVEAWTKHNWMHPSAWLVPRRLIEEAGPWDESLSLHDDGEFFSRVLLKSKGVKFCDDAISYYRKGIHNSLSSTFSDKAIHSHFKICQLYEKQLLKVEDSKRTRRACAINFLQFHYTHYPDYPLYRKKALQEAKKLGAITGEPLGTELFQLLKKFLGWKIARRIEKFYYGNGLNYSALKQRITNWVSYAR